MAMGVVLYRFQLTPSSPDPIRISSLDFTLSGLSGLVASDLGNVQLVEDADLDGLADPEETVRVSLAVEFFSMTGHCPIATAEFVGKRSGARTRPRGRAG